VYAKSKNPRCFKKINRRLLRVIYRYNKTKVDDKAAYGRILAVLR